MRSDNGLAYAHGTSERKRWVRWAWLFFLAWVILAVIAAFIAQNGIENDLGSRVNNLGDGAVDGVDVSFDGRDATITGAVASEAEKGRIIATVAGADDVGTVDASGLDVAQAAPAAAAAIIATDADGVVTLTGVVPDEEARDAAIDAASDAPNVSEVVDEMTIDPDVAAAGWTPAITGVLAAASPAAGRAASFNPDTVTVSGVLPSEDDREGVIADVEAAAPDGWTVNDQLTVEEAPVLGTSSLVASDADGVVTLTGAVADEATRDAAIGAAAAAPNVSEVIDEMTIDPNVAVADWTPSMTGVLAAATPAAGRNVSFDPDTITVSGVVPDEATKASVIADAEAAAPDGWTVVDRLTIEGPDTNQRLADLLNGQGDVFFATSSADLTSEGIAILDQVVVVMNETEESVEISGYTDDRGGAESNQALSQARADSVRGYLTSAGIDEGRMTPVGQGITDQFGDNSTPEGRALNRRIEITVIDETEGAG